MSFKSMVRELKEMSDGFGSSSRRGNVGALQSPCPNFRYQNQEKEEVEDFEQGKWANLPPELLLDVIQRVEASEATWPMRRSVVSCSSVCKGWREITKEVVETPEQCGRITFPISLKQPGPRDWQIQCFIRRNRATSTYELCLGLSPSTQSENDKLLLAARRIRRATSTEFVISLSCDDFSRSSSTYIGKLKSNFLGTKFTISDTQPPHNTPIIPKHSSRRFHSNRISPKIPAGNYKIASVFYELNILRTRGPRRMQCTLQSIPVSSIQQGGTAPTPTAFIHSLDQLSSTSSCTSKGKGDPDIEVSSISLNEFVAAVDSRHQVSTAEQDRVILQFGKIGKDIFTMDYRYPLSAFQAFAICLSSFDTKPVCE